MNNTQLGATLTRTLNKLSEKQFQENLKNNKKIDKMNKERLERVAKYKALNN
jgi:hypothetical protein